jgi:thiol-disulfide isomerase/thioredoxin
MELQAANEEFYRRQNAGQSQDSLQKFAMQIQMAGQAFESTLKSRVTASKEPFVSLYYVSFLPMNKYPKENGDVIKLMEKSYPNSEYTKEMKSAYAQIEMQAKAAEMKQKAESATAIGSTAIDLDYPSPSGKNIKLSSLRGKVVLLDFWASWCGPCRRENPSVVAAYNKYKDKGFTVYSVSLDQDKARWTSAIAQDGLLWENHVSDLKGWSAEPAAKYGVQSIPAQFLLDKDGKIIAKNLRGEELDRKLEEVLK